MGNARWLGVPLKDVLARAELEGQRAAGRPSTGSTPALLGGGDFVKSLDIGHAMDGEVMLAYQMNGADLPMLNGYPRAAGRAGLLRHLLGQAPVGRSRSIDQVFDGFWMKPAYRIPDNACACVEPGTAPAATRPIGRFNVRSFITSVPTARACTPASQLRRARHRLRRRPGHPRGRLFDRRRPEPGAGRQLGAGPRAAIRSASSRFGFTPRPGSHDLRVRAWNRSGQSQPMEALWQPAGYMRNVVESVKISAA